MGAGGASGAPSIDGHDEDDEKGNAMKSFWWIAGLGLVAVALVLGVSRLRAAPSAASAAAAKPAAQGSAAGYAKATFAGGCFWCMEGPYDNLDGVVSTTSGYTGGVKKNPTYEEVSAGGTGHTESVQVVYDPKKVTYEKLLYVYWRNVDPTVKDQQFCDHGNQYRTAIFYQDEAQRKAAEASKAALEQGKKLPGSIQTEIVAASTFYPAEDYHQDYYVKNPLRYKFYRHNCGRDARLGQLWGAEAGGGAH
jgi:peptide-methionine (S)-S-oxide reductase